MARKYVAGVDGGASKTMAVVGDTDGNILGWGQDGPSNYQVVGLNSAMQAVERSLGAALEQAGITTRELSQVVLGLAGADLPDDFKNLYSALDKAFPEHNYTLTNDCWVALRAGTECPWAVVSICGTGGNAAGRNRQGREVILRGLGFEFGNWGGGSDVTRDALHRAFRSDERTGPKTRLEEEILSLLGMQNYSQLAQEMRDDLGLQYRALWSVPQLVFRLAFEGDRVCQDILVRLGKAQGESCGGVIRRLGMTEEEVDVVLSGGLYRAAQTGTPLLIDAFVLAVHRVAPRAHIHLAKYQPVVGAYLLALESQGVKLDEENYRRLDQSLVEAGCRF